VKLGHLTLAENLTLFWRKQIKEKHVRNKCKIPVSSQKVSVHLSASMGAS